MLLFKVEEIFTITGRGLILVPGLGSKDAKIGDKIKIVKPDKTTVETIIQGISFNSKFRDILIRGDLTKDDIPIGSEVWLNV